MFGIAPIDSQATGMRSLYEPEAGNCGKGGKLALKRAARLQVESILN